MRLEEQLSEFSDAEVYYLLTAVNTMALSRPLEDWTFIRATVLQLLEIGFLSPTTRDSCFKSARIMLVNLTLRHTPLISDILDRLNTSANCGKVNGLS
ncbi:Ectopic P granules protein 5 [Homalodisca vitripennis]|nr:Ectopic P granules protein 5 [Homalodisca vitripennis]